MYAAAPDSHGGGGGVEILIFQLTDTPTVEGIGIVSAECLDIKVVSASANLLIRRESYPYFSVFQSGVRQKVFNGSDYLCYASLVIRSQKGRTVRGDNGLSAVPGQFRKIIW